MVAGVSGAGILAEFNHCGEVIRTNTKWKCTASDMTHGFTPPANWMSEILYDSITPSHRFVVVIGS
jgi:hypothetical protein